jgi:type 1 glutamine amidotransferase
MNTTRRQFLTTTAATGLGALGSASLSRRVIAQDELPKKRALAILGDDWHCFAPLYGSIVGTLKKRGYQPVSIMDYAVPFDDFDQYDLIAMSRNAWEHVNYYREHDVNPSLKRGACWLTADQEQKFEDYVNAGGRLLLHHDAIGFYLKGRAITRLAKAYFIRHPAIVNIEISPTGKMPELTAGVTPFSAADEEYEVEMDENQTSVYLESNSPEHGRAPQGWAHTYGKGKVAVLIPGHSHQVLSHAMVRRCLQNVIDWLGK